MNARDCRTAWTLYRWASTGYSISEVKNYKNKDMMLTEVTTSRAKALACEDKNNPKIQQYINTLNKIEKLLK